MAFFEFPHTRTYDTDLGWLIKSFKEISSKLDEYLENAVITFADPITWDITEQYTALTCVIDSDGTAYLSKQPVPAGVDISNTNYWLPIFNYDDNINELRDQIAYNARNSATTGIALQAGDLVFWEGLLYEVLTDMTAGSAFIEGTNIQRYTVDEKINDIYSALDTQISTLQSQIAYNAGDDAATSVSLSTNDLVFWNGLLYQVTTDMAPGTAFIIGTNIQAYTVDDKINDIYNDLNETIGYVDPRYFGAKLDGVTDDTSAFAAALAVGSVMMPPELSVVLNGLVLPENRTIDFNNGIVYTSGNAIVCNDIASLSLHRNAEIKNGRFYSTGSDAVIKLYECIFTHIVNCYYTQPTANSVFIHAENCFNLTIERCFVGISLATQATGSRGIEIVSTVTGGYIGSANGTNISVKDCLLQHLAYGLYIEYTNTGVFDSGLIQNVGCSGCNYGIYLSGSVSHIISSALINIRAEYCGTAIYSNATIALIGAHFYNKTGNTMTCINNPGHMTISGSIYQTGASSVFINNGGRLVNAGALFNYVDWSGSTFGYNTSHVYYPVPQSSVAGCAIPLFNYIIRTSSALDMNSYPNPTEGCEVTILPEANIVLTVGTHTYQMTGWKYTTLHYLNGGWRLPDTLTQLT